MIQARIVGTGSYAPKKVVTNHDLEKLIETSDEWIIERTGIKERRVAEKHEATSDLAYEASIKALKAAGLHASDLDLILVATLTPDVAMPNTACILQHKLNAKKAGALDINAACSGFIYGLSVASALIKAGTAENILLVGAEVLSRFVDWQDRTTCVLFGDGAGAAVLQRHAGKRGILSTHLHADGSLADLLHIEAGGSRLPSTHETVDGRMHYVKMRGNETFKVAVRALEDVVQEALEFNKIKPEEIDLLVPHQANLRIIQAMAKRLNMPMEKVVVTIQKYGNTSAASIPMALDEAVRDGRIKEHNMILLEAFGGGLTWASALIRW
ncbi:MAG: 3-oxoacyl-ACP synthase [Nitrospirae bacterium GWC2_57_13]|jgi:3-oxoacyl-[acyl-carrier-protein] synthase III|nr:MAG: 3-oxoacyl-ACP synthase [Nitrospirae bacterium GWC2_57_13]OGW45011.1 MAG: 3-oxoacyl-ACP synthase [Nitrospirae bacterium GWD2_57_8]HAR45542.1 3-oxoacyl-ACP synthase [Nitrospiraceae bacterium]